MPLDTAKERLKKENGMVSTLDLITAKAQDKLSTGLIYILSHVEKVTSKIRLAASATRSRAKGIIEAHRISKIKPVTGTSGQVLQYGVSGYNWGNNTGHYNTAVGYQAGYAYAGSGLSIGNLAPTNNTITFGNPSNPSVLVITADGEVEWNGKPSEAAEALKRTFQFAVEDMKGVTKAARRRYYLKACQNILNKAEKMEHQEFLDFLQKQVYNKERRAIIDALKGEQ